ncbi:hypothetical protein [Nonomuraea sp. NPDC050540]|uniref:hypothetical protein n=1 Tax=Nonomuraea sp. NPDC050540 TaxID=3364367 RepID=UPI003797C22E
MRFDLVPVTRLYGGGLFFDSEHGPGLVEAYVEWTATVPKAMNSSVALIPFPDHPSVPEPMPGRYVYHVRIAFTGPLEDGERLVRPLRLIGPRIMETLSEPPYSQSSSIHDDPPVAMSWAAGHDVTAHASLAVQFS